MMSIAGLSPIHPLTLVPNFRVGTNVFLWNEKTNSTVKFLSSDQVVTESTFNFLYANPSQKLFISETSQNSYREYLSEHLETSVSKPRVPRVLKTAVLAENLRWRLADAFATRSVEQILKSSRECSQRLVLLGRQIQLNGRECQRTLAHDSSFVTHSVNTAFYAFLIANAQGYGEEMISEICAGSMLHDIGKLKLETAESDAGISAEPSNDWSLRRQRSHPTDGFRVLCRENGVLETHLMIVYQHHERPDGMGFPVGLLADEIHVASRICSVANRYDGLTCVRPQRPEMTRLAAIRILETEKNKALDSEVVKCLEQVMSQTSVS